MLEKCGPSEELLSLFPVVVTSLVGWDVDKRPLWKRKRLASLFLPPVSFCFQSFSNDIKLVKDAVLVRFRQNLLSRHIFRRDTVVKT